MTSGHGLTHAHQTQGSRGRDYELVDYEVPLLHPQARADSDEEMEGEKEPTLVSTTQHPPPTPPKDTSQSPRRSSTAPLTTSPLKMTSSNSSSSSSSSSSNSPSKSHPPTPPKAVPKAASKPKALNAPISLIDDQRLTMPARAYASTDSALNTRGAAVGSGPASTSVPVPSTSVSGPSGALIGPVNPASKSSSSTSGPSSGYGPEQGVGSRGASLFGSQSRELSSTASSSAGKTATGMQSSYGSGDGPRSGKFGSMAALVGQNQFAAVQLQNISSPLSADLSLSFSPSLSSVPPSSSSPSSSPTFFTPPSTSPPVVSQVQTQATRSPSAFPRPSSSAAAFRSSPLAHTRTVNVNAMSTSNSNTSNKGDYFAVPPSSPGPADLTHAPSSLPPPAVASAPHSNPGPFPPSSSLSSGPGMISGLPSFTSSSATVVAPATPGMTNSTSASTVPTLSSTSTTSMASPSAAFAAPPARPPGGNVKPPYQMQRVPSEGMENGQGHGSRRASADSGTLLKDNNYNYSHPPPPTFSHHVYPHPGPVPRPELHSSASRGSMILYRLSATEDGILPPHPGINHGLNRSSVYSNSGDSIVSLGQDSKYPLVGLGINHTGNGTHTPPRMNTGGSGFSSIGGRAPSALSQMQVPLFQGQGSIGSRGGTSLMFSEIGRSNGGLVAYAYDPDEDEDADELDEEEEEWIRMVGGRVVGGYYHVKGATTVVAPTKGEKASSNSSGTSASSAQATKPGPGVVRSSTLSKKKLVHSQTVAYKPSSLRSRHDVPWRGVMNIATLVVLISGLFCLFIVYPVTKVYTNDGVEARILGNTRINATGQAVGDLVDPAGNGTTLTATGVGAGDAASDSGKGKEDNGGVAKMDVGPNSRKREVLEQLEVDARRRMERWERLGVARFRREQ